MSPYVIPGLKRQLVTQADIIEECSKAYDVNSKNIFHKTRTKGLVQARKTSMWLMSKKLSMTNQEVAEVFKTDRTNVSKSIKDVDEKMQIYRDYRSEIETLIKNIWNENLLHL